MIDYVKIYLKNINISKLLLNSELDFRCSVSISTGEILEDTLIAKYHFCQITIKNAKSEMPHVLFTGSVHKLWNSLNDIKAPNFNKGTTYKGFNGNLFKLSNIIEVRIHLEKLFDCKASQMIFQNIEFGINVKVSFNPKFFIKGLLYHKNIKFEFRHRNNFAEVVHNRFLLKIYNKSNQYCMKENILRIELKIIKMEELKPLEIKTFADLNVDSILKAKDLILKRFDEIVQYDYTINRIQLSKREAKLLDNYSNSHYWIDTLKPNHRDIHKKKLNSLILAHSVNLHYQIRIEIIEKYVMINRLSENEKKENYVMVNHSNIGLNVTYTYCKSQTIVV